MSRPKCTNVLFSNKAKDGCQSLNYSRIQPEGFLLGSHCTHIFICLPCVLKVDSRHD